MSAYPWSPISKDEGTLLRAFAILAIVFHNYLHWISDSPGENEFTYRPERIQALIDGLWNTPWDAIRLTATYFGHYGVQIFFFLSAYGLTLKYQNASPSWWMFQKSRWSRLFPAIIAAAIGYIIYESLRLGWQHVFQQEGLNLLRQAVGISNFIPDNIYHPIGPWWFIGVILQFYLIAPTIIQWSKNHGNKVLYLLAVGSILSEMLFAPLLSKQFDFNLNHSIIGHLDVCALGIYFARKHSFALPHSVIIGAAILFLLGNFHATLWISTGVTLLILILPIARSGSKWVQSHPRLQRSLFFIGHLSMYIFLCNGYLRKPLIEWAQGQNHWWTSLWTSLVFLTVVILWSMALRTCTQGVFKRLTR